MIQAILGSILSGIFNAIIEPIRRWWRERQLANLRRENVDLRVQLEKEKLRVKRVVHERELDEDLRYVQDAKTDKEFIERWREVQRK